MRHSFLDRYSDGSSLVHDLDPRVKIAAAALFVVAAVTVRPDRPESYLILLLIWLAAALTARVPMSFHLRRWAEVIPFALAAAAFIPFFHDSPTIVRPPVIGWPPMGLEGLALAGHVLARVSLAVLAMNLLVSTTPFTRILYGLEWLKLPRIFITLLSFMYRYIFLLVDEAERLAQARSSRLSASGGVAAMRSLAYLTGALLLRSFDRSEMVYAAMRARGFDGHARVLAPPRLRRMDVLMGSAFVLILICLKLIEWSHV